jgi:hypothetical protein
MLSPEQKALLLAMIGQEIDSLIERSQAAVNAHPLREDDWISPEQAEESEQFALEFERLNDLMEAIEGDTVDPAELAYFVDRMVKGQGEQRMH